MCAPYSGIRCRPSGSWVPRRQPRSSLREISRHHSSATWPRHSPSRVPSCACSASPASRGGGAWVWRWRAGKTSTTPKRPQFALLRLSKSTRRKPIASDNRSCGVRRRAHVPPAGPPSAGSIRSRRMDARRLLGMPNRHVSRLAWPVCRQQFGRVNSAALPECALCFFLTCKLESQTSTPYS